MGAFGGLILTNKGRNLQAKAQAGATLSFTRIATGDGELAGQSISELNVLISEKQSLEIIKLKTLQDNKAVVGAVLSNQDLVTGYYFREIGVFATDPDLGEILYCYGNAGSNAEYIPAGGGPDIVEKNIDVVTIVGNASSVTANIDESLVFATADHTHPDATTSEDGFMSAADKAKLDGIEEGATNYQHPATHPATMIVEDTTHRFVTDTEKTDWNGKETPAGAQAKVDEHKNTATGAHQATAIAIQDTEGHFTATDVEGALAELFQNVSDGKIDVAAAIADMNQYADESFTFAQLAAAIRAISSDADALVGDVLSGKTFYQGGTKKTGTIPNRGTGGTVTPGTTNQVKSAGYYSSDITILGDADLISSNIKTGVTLFGVTGNVVEATGNANTSDVLTGKTFSKAGSAGLTGTMPNRGAYNITPGTTNKTIPAGYHNGAGLVYGDADLVAANIKSGVNIFGVAGSLIPLTAEKKWASGTTTSSGSGLISVRGLSFTPKYVIAKYTVYANSEAGFSIYAKMTDLGTSYDINTKVGSTTQDPDPGSFTSYVDGFDIYVTAYNIDHTWIAFE